MSEPWEPDLAPSDEEYFLSVLDELRSLTGLRATPYQAIRAAGLLRILLTSDNGGTLVDKMTRSTGLPAPEYAVMVFLARRTHKGEAFSIAGVLVDPRVSEVLLIQRVPFEERKPHVLSMKQFLKTPVLTTSGEQHVSVLELIHLYANKMGGAHRENSGTEAKSEVLSRFLPEWEPVLRQSLIAAARVTLEAVRPLELLLALGERPLPLGLDMNARWSPKTPQDPPVEELSSRETV